MEAAGLVVGAAGLIGVVNAVIEDIRYIQLGRDFNTGFRTFRTRLDLVEIRQTRMSSFFEEASMTWTRNVKLRSSQPTMH